ncbi:MAG: DUF3619 family protein [Burkholderiales bacterium]|nr:DUF3619 family protein [Burkholderiales bacterium]
MNRRSRLPDLQAIEARLAARLSSGLTERAQQLPHDIGERLRVAREQALARAAHARRVAPQSRAASEVAVVGVTSGGMALMGSAAPWWQRAASVLPLLLLVFGLLLIQRQGELEQVRAAAEVDALLLSDDLPPAAYVDPGFAEFLREPAP